MKIDNYKSTQPKEKNQGNQNYLFAEITKTDENLSWKIMGKKEIEFQRR